jgi:hypothetical protein
MPRARRNLSQSEILSMVLSTSDAQRLRGEWPEDRRRDSVSSTAMFLWLALALTLLALAGTFVWEAVRWAEQDCDDGAGSGARVECAQRGKHEARGEGKDVGHGAKSAVPAGGSA